MKLTLDRLCISSEKLCPKCKKKMAEGETTQLDIKVGQTLLNVAKSQRFLSDINLKNIIETKNAIYLVLATKKDVEKLEKTGEHLQNQLQDIKEKEFNFIEKTKNSKKLLENILSPVVPVGNSTILLPPDGTKELKVKIKKSDKDKLGLDAIELSKITGQLLGMSAHYAYV